MAVDVKLCRPTAKREAQFLDAVCRSRALHRKLVSPPDTPERYRRFMAVGRRANHEQFLILHSQEDALVGVVELSNIVRGSFQSAYLGYYGFEPYTGRGLMRAGLGLAIDHAFKKLKLHRLEANIQPHNERSAGVVESLGFRREGYSPRYLKISGRWRDHERWAILAEEWRAGRR